MKIVSFIIFIYLCVWILCLHVYLGTMCMPSTYGSQKMVWVGSSRTAVMVVIHHASWGSNSGTLEKQLVLLTTDPPRQSFNNLKYHIVTNLKLSTILKYNTSLLFRILLYQNKLEYFIRKRKCATSP